MAHHCSSPYQSLEDQTLIAIFRPFSNNIIVKDNIETNSCWGSCLNTLENLLNLDTDSWTYYFVPRIHTLAYSCYDITDKDTLGHLVIYNGNFAWGIYHAGSEASFWYLTDY